MSSSQLDIDKLIATRAEARDQPLFHARQHRNRTRPVSSHARTLVAQGHINVEKITTRPYIVGPANVEMRIYTDRAEFLADLHRDVWRNIADFLTGGPRNRSSAIQRECADA